LTSVDLSGVKSIGDDAFSDNNLTSIKIPRKFSDRIKNILGYINIDDVTITYYEDEGEGDELSKYFNKYKKYKLKYLNLFNKKTNINFNKNKNYKLLYNKYKLKYINSK
jgi:hypothetical protein